MSNSCELCKYDQSTALWQGNKFFVIAVNDERFPGYTRLIWKEHIAEVTDLSEQDRTLMWQALSLIEQTMRETMHPTKINLAQLGNMVPHLHWHIIPRYKNDTHFPESIWGMQQRKLPSETANRKILAEYFYEKLSEVLAQKFC